MTKISFYSQTRIPYTKYAARRRRRRLEPVSGADSHENNHAKSGVQKHYAIAARPTSRPATKTHHHATKEQGGCSFETAGEMMQRRFAYALAFALFLAFPIAGQAFELNVRSAIVMNMSTGQVLYEQNPDELIPPASLTKIMTMYLTYEQIEAGTLRYEDKALVSDFAEHAGGSRMGAKAGQNIRVSELLEGMAVASANDACVAMAEHLPGGPGSYEAFIKRMNEKSETLGMTRTTFINPNGMPAKGQFTTARDMLRLAVDYIQRFPHSLKLHAMEVTTHDDWIRHNRNRLLGTCEGVDGLKTGFVRASGYNIIATAQRKGERIVAVIMGATTSPIRKEETRKALEAAFAKELNAGPSLAQAAPTTPPKEPEVVWRVVAPNADKSQVAAEPKPSALSGQSLTLFAPSPQPAIQDIAPQPTPTPSGAGRQEKAAAPEGATANHVESIGHIPTSRLVVKHTRANRHAFEENPD
jgi:D-alanyl-D-alanine carboxypeptidase